MSAADEDAGAAMKDEKADDKAEKGGDFVRFEIKKWNAVCM